MSPDGPAEERVIWNERFQGEQFDFRGKIIFIRFDGCEFVNCILLIDHETGGQIHSAASRRSRLSLEALAFDAATDRIRQPPGGRAIRPISPSLVQRQRPAGEALEAVTKAS